VRIAFDFPRDIKINRREVAQQVAMEDATQDARDASGESAA
jgi:sRNA-binding carbon storage regulator CsrA